ncbi:MAG: proline--tRNA ligase [Candidatus Omnitrophica bacterium]|nr:proline--tRNA ligase [Candidatus Omnitrophota bacterium]MDD5238326.1 proline--tRNA ligase [Candidatus Omnitrophota bacterium]
MLWSKTFIPTLKENPQEAESISHQLLLRAGLIRLLMGGVYSYLPLGFKVLNNIQAIIRQEMNSCGAVELLLPALQPLELWLKSGRSEAIAEVMIRFTDRRGRKLCLGPTHEEVITDLVGRHVSSYKQLPLVLYQIQTKFRDEIRPRFGLVRACEFIMKDAYSFDKDEEGLNRNYKAMYDAYKNIFKRCGLQIITTEADPGVMGGSVSHEFMAQSKDGEDIVLLCPKCKSAKTYKEGDKEVCAKCGEKADKINTIEVGHIFQLGTKYSSTLGANFLDAQGKLLPIIMGCYGIGVSRLISAVIEQNYDKDGIIWPNEIAPYRIIILPLDVTDNDVTKTAYSLYEKLEKKGLEPLFDDRDERAGVKFKDADLLGIPLQVVIGRQSLKDNLIELKIRRSHEKIMKPENEILSEIDRFING